MGYLGSGSAPKGSSMAYTWLALCSAVLQHECLFQMPSFCFHLPCNLKANKSLHKWCRLRYFVVIAISGGLRSPCIDVSLQPVPLIQSHLPGPLSIFSLGQGSFLGTPEFQPWEYNAKGFELKNKTQEICGLHRQNVSSSIDIHILQRTEIFLSLTQLKLDFFLSCVPTLLLEGLNFSTQIIQGLAKPWSMKMASVTYDCEHHLKGLRTLPPWSGLKSHEAEWVTFPSSHHDEGQAYKTHPEF